MCIHRKEHNIITVLYYPWFWASIGSLRLYPPQIGAEGPAVYIKNQQKYNTYCTPTHDSLFKTFKLFLFLCEVGAIGTTHEFVTLSEFGIGSGIRIGVGHHSMTPPRMVQRRILTTKHVSEKTYQGEMGLVLLVFWKVGSFLWINLVKCIMI